MRIEPQMQAFRPNPTPSRFNEGASTTAQKVTALAIALLGSAASFFCLPIEGAVLITTTLAALYGGWILFSDCGDAGEERPQEERPWYLNLFQNLPAVINRAEVQPVLQPGPRVIPGGGHLRPQEVRRVVHHNQQPAVVHAHLPQPVHVPPAVNFNQAHVPVGHGHQQPAVVHAHLPQAVHVPPAVNLNQAHVPVGHGHQQPAFVHAPLPQPAAPILNPQHQAHVPVGHGH